MKVPRDGTVSHLQNGGLGRISFDSAEAASSGLHIRKTSMKNRFQMGSELTGLLAKPGMEMIYVLIFCVFFKSSHQAFVRDHVKPCFLRRGKQALPITSKLSTHGHRRMSHKPAKTRAC